MDLARTEPPGQGGGGGRDHGTGTILPATSDNNNEPQGSSSAHTSAKQRALQEKKRKRLAKKRNAMRTKRAQAPLVKAALKAVSARVATKKRPSNEGESRDANRLRNRLPRPRSHTSRAFVPHSDPSASLKDQVSVCLPRKPASPSLDTDTLPFRNTHT